MLCKPQAFTWSWTSHLLNLAFLLHLSFLLLHINCQKQPSVKAVLSAALNSSSGSTLATILAHQMCLLVLSLVHIDIQIFILQVINPKPWFNQHSWSSNSSQAAGCPSLVWTQGSQTSWFAELRQQVEILLSGRVWCVSHQKKDVFQFRILFTL